MDFAHGLIGGLLVAFSIVIAAACLTCPTDGDSRGERLATASVPEVAPGLTVAGK